MISIKEPLISIPIFVEKPWGVDGILENKKIGEIWLVSGMSGFQTQLKGLYTSKDYGTVNDLLEPFFSNCFPRFPFLLKRILTSQWLSIQVHPDNELARIQDNEPWGKNEAWIAINEETKVFVSSNVKKITKALDNEKIWDELFFEKILKKYDILFLPAGVVHSLGPKADVIEIQQASDLTYRLYDWGRKREIHKEKGLKALKEISYSIVRNFSVFETKYFNIEITDDKIIRGFCLVYDLKEKKSLIIPPGIDFEVKNKSLIFTLGEWWYE